MNIHDYVSAHIKSTKHFFLPLQILNEYWKRLGTRPVEGQSMMMQISTTYIVIRCSSHHAEECLTYTTIHFRSPHTYNIIIERDGGHCPKHRGMLRTEVFESNVPFLNYSNNYVRQSIKLQTNSE